MNIVSYKLYKPFYKNSYKLNKNQITMEGLYYKQSDNLNLLFEEADLSRLESEALLEGTTKRKRDNYHPRRFFQVSKQIGALFYATLDKHTYWITISEEGIQRLRTEGHLEFELEQGIVTAEYEEPL